MDSNGPFPPYPFARRGDASEVFHGVELVDPYQWLEEGQSAETLDWIGAQNAYAHSLLDGLAARPRITGRLTDLLHHDALGLPIERSGYYFFMKRRAGEDQWCIYRRNGIDGRDELLVDPHPLSPDHSASVIIYEPTDDAGMMLYGVRMTGVDETDIRVLDLNSGRELRDRIPPALHYNVTWTRDGSGFYYYHCARGEDPRIYLHMLGTDPASDREIFGEGYGPENGMRAVESEDGRYLLIVVGWGWLRDEVFLCDLAGDGPLRPLITEIAANFIPAFTGDQLIVRTDWNAPRGRVLKIDLRDPAREKWREIVPEAGDAIQSVSVIGERLFVSYLHDVTSRIAIISLVGSPLGEVPMQGVGTAGIYGRHGHDEGGFHFTSYTTPLSIYRYRASLGERTLWYQNPVPYTSDRFETRQVWYSSKDGTPVPMFLVHRKGLVFDGGRTTVLYGYGGFNASLTPSFSAEVAWWIEQGGIYAVPNLRGGGEFGETWHRAGMLGNKQNVFDDFIAAAEWLFANNFTNLDKLAISGVSNGGLLVGAVMTQRPELMRAVVCKYPDLDMIRSRRYSKNNCLPSLLEYGDPAIADQFRFIAAYSPYEHVREGIKYPAVLFTTGEADTRAPAAQARKMTARMQAASASGLPILLLHDPKAGHAGGRGLAKIVEDLSLEWSFLAWQLGI